MIQWPKAQRTVFAPASALVCVLALLISGCEADTSDDDAVVGKGAMRHNSADVEFATRMLPHQAQAVAMVNVTLGENLDPAVAMTAEQMLTARSSVVTKMEGLVQDWGQRIPRTMIDHVGHAMGDTSMPGALSKSEFHRLESAKGPRLERAWLQAMIAHHEGAIQMAETEQAEGANPAAKRLASQIIRTHQAELRELRGQLSG